VIDIDGVYGPYRDVDLRSHGRHQVDNFAVAVAAAEAFLGRQLDEEAVATAGRLPMPARMEVMDTAPLLMVDGAHNAPAVAALVAALRREYPTTTWSLVFGAMRDKEIPEMVASLAPLVDRAFMVAAATSRAAAPDDLVDAAAAAGIDAVACPGVAAGLWQAIDTAGDDGAVLVAGSLYVAGEARRAFITGR
jgi:folylpolyglutamate synthase/dihydropteroate synthase